VHWVGYYTYNYIYLLKILYYIFRNWSKLATAKEGRNGIVKRDKHYKMAAAESEQGESEATSNIMYLSYSFSKLYRKMCKDLLKISDKKELKA
jgi:hypothetical protein